MKKWEEKREKERKKCPLTGRDRRDWETGLLGRLNVAGKVGRKLCPKFKKGVRVRLLTSMSSDSLTLNLAGDRNMGSLFIPIIPRFLHLL